MTEDLKKLLEAATPLPWYQVYDPAVFTSMISCDGEEGAIAFGVKPFNAALICAAVNALPELLERVKRLEEALKPFADEADKWANCIDKDAQEILIAHPIDVTVDSYGEIDGLNDAAFTLGDLRRARTALKETGQ